MTLEIIGTIIGGVGSLFAIALSIYLRKKVKNYKKHITREDRIRDVVEEIFYSPATNGKAEESIQRGVQLVKALLCECGRNKDTGLICDEDAPHKAFLAFNRFFPDVKEGAFMSTWINGYVAAIRDEENRRMKMQ